jgi:Mg2+/Co2+ transporter CorB
MTLDVTLIVLTILCLQVIGAYFSAAETALTAVSKGRMHVLAVEGSRQAHAADALISDRERMIGAMLLGRNLVNVLTAVLATALVLRLMGERALPLTVIVLTAAIVVFAEVLPRSVAIVHTEAIALGVARPMRAMVTVLSPFAAAAQFLVWRVLRIFRLRPVTEAAVLSAHQELRGTIDLHHEEGSVEREQRDMLGGILDLRELQVSDVMVHRKHMVVISADGVVQETVDLVLTSGHTRFPIWKDDPENIVGVLHIKDLLRALTQRRGSLEGIDILALAHEPWFVPDTTTLDEQVHAFRERRAHFALVVDEYGTLQGLVTLEDILEEIFGDIGESHDTAAQEGPVPGPDGSYVIEAATPIRELNRELHWELPDEDATTIAGLVINEARTIPDVGQLFAFHGFKFEILARHRNQITTLRITPPGKPAVPNDAALSARS